MSDVRLQNVILEIWGSGNRLELAGGTRPGNHKYQPFKSLYKNPLDKSS